MAMTAPPRPQPHATRRPAPATPPAQGTGFSPIDPIKLLHKYKWVLIGSLVLGGLVGIAANYALLEVSPSYSAYSIFQVSAPKTDASLAAERVDENELERFMATQVQRMKSETVLDAAVNRPAIATQASNWYNQFKTSSGFDPVKARQELEDIVSAREVPGTQLIRLSVSGKYPADITYLARAVREEYLKSLSLTERETNRNQIEALIQQIEGLDTSITNLKNDRAAKLTDTGSSSAQGTEAAILGARTTEESITLQKINDQLVDVRFALSALKKAMLRYEDDAKNPGGPVYDDELRSEVEKQPLINSLKQSVSMLEAQQLALQNEGLRPEHQEWKRLQAALDGQRAQLEAQRQSELSNLFSARIDATRNQIAQLEAQETDLIIRRDASKTMLDQLTFVQAEIRDIDDEIGRLSDSRNRLNDELANLQALKTQATRKPDDTGTSLYLDRISVLTFEKKPDKVDFPKLKIMLPVGVLLFGGLAGGLIVLRELLDQRIKSPADVTLIPRTRALGMVPYAPDDSASIETAFRDQPAGVLAESYRQLRSAVLTQLDESGARSLLVAGGMPASGATSVAINLAFACAAADRSVLLIDANLRRPATHRVLGLDEDPGMADVLAGETTLQDAVQQADTPNLSILTVGSSENRVYERLSGRAMGQLLEEASKAYDLVLIDTAPAIVSGDAVAIANRCDASMLVVKALSEKRGMVARLRSELDQSRSMFLGVLVNAVRPAAGGYLKRNIRVAHQYQSSS